MKKLTALSLITIFCTSIVLLAQVGAPGSGGINSVGSGGGSGASTSAHYVTTVTESTLPNSYPLVNGTQTASNPLVFSQTWNNAAVEFEQLKVVSTLTAADSNSASILVLGGAAGTTRIFCAGGCADGTAVLNASATQVQTFGDLKVGNGQLTIDSGRYYIVQGRTYRHAPSDRDYAIGSDGSSGPEFTIKVGAVPTIDANFGTGRAIAGTNSVGRITSGTTTANPGTVTFSQAWTTNAPVCTVYDETAKAFVALQSQTTSVITFNLVDSHSYTYTCFGYQ